MEKTLTKEDFTKLVLAYSGKENDCKYMMNEPDSDVYKSFSLKTLEGKAFYDTVSDEELLILLKELSIKLDHSPAQGEVFWALRSFIKERFRKWPRALELAGLSKGAGAGGKSFDKIEEDRKEREDDLDELRELTLKLGHIPHPRKYPKLSKRIKRFYSSWGEAVRAAGIDPIELGRQTVKKIVTDDPELIDKLEKVHNRAIELGRSPMHTEVDKQIKKPLLEYYGSWRNVLYQIDLEPVVRIKPFERYYVDHRKEMNRTSHSMNVRNCYYKLVEPDSIVMENLEGLRAMIDELGYVPDRDQIPDDMRKILIEACSSWANVLYQLDLK